MPSLATVDFSSMMVMLKGEPGTRKSTQALTFPMKQYWISTDRKMESLIVPATKWGIDMTQVDYDDYDDFDKIIAKLKKFQLNCPYRTIVLDSVTTTGDNINLQTQRAKAGKVTKAGEESDFKIGGISVNTLQDYKGEASAFAQITAALKDIAKFHKVNIVIIAHVVGERAPTQAQGSSHFSRVIITGGKAISAKIPAYCTEVYQMYAKPNGNVDQEGTYEMYTVHMGDDFARTALDLPHQINLTGKKLYGDIMAPAILKLKPLTQPTTKP